MKKLTLLSVLAALCLYGSINAQGIAAPSLYVGERIPDLHFKNIINHSSDTATISLLQSNRQKLILFDFWFTSCASCIKQFSKLDSLQKKFDRQLQIVLVTREPAEIIIPFLKNWENKNNIKLSIPVLAGDTILHDYFRQLYNPHYAWIAPDNVVLAQTDLTLVNEQIIAAYLYNMQADMESRGYIYRDNL